MIAERDVITHLRQDEAEGIVRATVAGLQRERSDPGLGSITRFFKRLAQHHEHCVKNVILIYHQRPNAMYVAEESVWKQNERSIRAGEKPIWLLKTTEEHNDPFAADEVFEVFDIEQTEGRSFPPCIQHSNREQQFVLFNYLYFSDYADECNVEYVRKLPSSSPEEAFARRVEAYFKGVMHEPSGRTILGEKLVEAEVELATYVVCQALNVNPGIKPLSVERIFGQRDTEVLDTLERSHHAASQVLSCLVSK